MGIIKKKLMAGLLTLAVAASVLGTVTPASAATLTAKQYLTKMEKASKKAKSYDVTQTTSMTMDMNGQSMNIKQTNKQICFQDPIKSKTVTTSKVTSAGTTQTSKSVVYLKETSKGKVYAFTSVDGEPYEKEDYTELFKNMSGRSDSLDTSMYSEAKIVKKSVKVNKIDTVQIEAKMDGSAMDEVMQALGIDSEQLAQLGIDFKSMDPIQITLWINKKNYLPVKMTMDMTAFCDSLCKNMAAALNEMSGMDEESTDATESFSFSCSSAKTTAVYKNYNKATKFNFPDFSK